MRLNLQLFAKSIEELAKEVIQGKYGNGQARKDALGSNYEAVQSMVNSMLGSSSTTKKPTTTTAPTTPATPTTPKGSEIADKTRQELLSSEPGAFTYEAPQSSWQNRIQETLDRILNKEPLSYDLNGDALYQQYKDQFMAQGKMASMDVMGQAQVATGGYGNSFAQTVGHQAYQGELQKLNDKFPELYQLALSQYNQEKQDLKDLYALYTDMDEREYGRAMDKINMDYGIYRDSVTDWHNDLNRADSEYWNMVEQEYRTERDAIADAETKKKYAYDTAMGMLSMGVTPSAQMLADAGISSADANAIVKKVNEAKVAAGGTSDFINKVKTSAKKGVVESIVSNVSDNKGNNSGDDTPGYTYEETPAVTSFTAKIRTQHEFARGTNPDNTKYKTYKDYVRGMLEKYEKDLTDNDIATISQKYGL